MGQRYQKEIEEILDQANAGAQGDKPSRRGVASRRPAPKPRVPRASVSRSIPLIPVRLSPAWLVVAGIGLLLASWVMRLFHLFPGAAGPLGWGGVALFILAYILYFTGPRRTVERRWRQRSIEDDPPNKSWRRRFWR
jgi:hypothetical protein